MRRAFSYVLVVEEDLPLATRPQHQHQTQTQTPFSLPRPIFSLPRLALFDRLYPVQSNSLCPNPSSLFFLFFVFLSGWDPFYLSSLISHLGLSQNGQKSSLQSYAESQARFQLSWPRRDWRRHGLYPFILPTLFLLSQFSFSFPYLVIFPSPVFVFKFLSLKKFLLNFGLLSISDNFNWFWFVVLTNCLCLVEFMLLICEL